MVENTEWEQGDKKDDVDDERVFVLISRSVAM